MTNTFNIAGTDGSVMVPGLNETGSLMAYVLYADSTGILQELNGCKAILRQYPGHSQATPRQSNIHSTNSWGGTLYYSPFIHKNAFAFTGKPIIQSFKSKKMAKSTTTGGVSADRIRNDAAFERTWENMEEFSRAGKAAKLLRSIFRNVTINAKDSWQTLLAGQRLLYRLVVCIPLVLPNIITDEAGYLTVAGSQQAY